MDPRLDILETGPLGVNCALVSAPDTASCVVIDPGGHADRIETCLQARRQTLARILLTHCHFDHIGGAGDLAARHPDAVLAAHPDAAAAVVDPDRNGSTLFAAGPVTAPAPGVSLNDGDTFAAAGLDWTVRHLPGHSPGSLVYYVEAAGLLFTGDTLFAGGIGRSDLPGGDGPLLLRGLQALLATLPGDTRVMPGHGPATTLAREAARNPYLR